MIHWAWLIPAMMFGAGVGVFTLAMFVGGDDDVEEEDAEPEIVTRPYIPHYSTDKDYDETCGLLEEG